MKPRVDWSPIYAMALIVVILSLFPYLLPQLGWNHSSAYASILTILLILTGRALFLRIKQRVPQNLSLTTALTGATLMGIAALICGLLDPDTSVIRGTPGSQITIPSTNAQARFGALQRTSGSHQPLEIAILPKTRAGFSLGDWGHAVLDNTLLSVGYQTSALLTARDSQNETLTITRPLGGGFLAPLLTFPENKQIADHQLPVDTLAIPARNLHLFVFLIDASTAHSDHFFRVAGGHAGILFDTQDAAGHSVPGGIAFVADRGTVSLAGVRLTPQIGEFPTLLVSSVPSPLATLCGLCAFLVGSFQIVIRRGLPRSSRLKSH